MISILVATVVIFGLAWCLGTQVRKHFLEDPDVAERRERTRENPSNK